MTFAPFEKDEPKLPSGLGIMLSRPSPDGEGLHVGVLYRHSDKSVRVLDLAWHKRLRNEKHAFSDPYHWKACMWIEGDLVVEAPGIRAYFELVATVSKDRIPYGCNPNGSYFDGEGRYVSDDAAHGLTCATFVARIFETVGHQVVDLACWELREGDEDWMREVVGQLEYHNPGRAAQVQQASVRFRLRPEEVAYAASAEAIPLDFHATVGPARELRTLLLRMD